MKCNIPTADLAQKLNDTVCRYKKEPVYLRVEKSKIYLYHLTDTHNYFETIKSTDPDFDVSGVPLGYFQNVNQKRVYYLTRFPQRRTKQGLDLRSLRVKSLNDDAVSSKHSSVNMFSKEFRDMIKGDYPDLGASIKALRADYSKDNKSRSEIAVSRNIALSINEIGEIHVYYKNNLVGYIQPDQFTVHVSNSEWSWVISRFLSHELAWEID